MAITVNLLKEAKESEETSIKLYEKALAAMVHDDSKKVVEGIIKNKKGSIDALQKIIERSKKCPAIINEGNGGMNEKN